MAPMRLTDPCVRLLSEYSWAARMFGQIGMMFVAVTPSARSLSASTRAWVDSWSGG